MIHIYLIGLCPGSKKLFMHFYAPVQFRFERYPVLMFFKNGSSSGEQYKNSESDVANLKTFLNEKMGRTPARTQVIIIILIGRKLYNKNRGNVLTFASYCFKCHT